MPYTPPGLLRSAKGRWKKNAPSKCLLVSALGPKASEARAYIMCLRITKEKKRTTRKRPNMCLLSAAAAAAATKTTTQPRQHARRAYIRHMHVPKSIKYLQYNTYAIVFSYHSLGMNDANHKMCVCVFFLFVDRRIVRGTRHTP